MLEDEEVDHPIKFPPELDQTGTEFVNVFLDKRLIPLMEANDKENGHTVDEMIVKLNERHGQTADQADLDKPPFPMAELESYWEQYRAYNPRYTGEATVDHVGAEIVRRLDVVFKGENEGNVLSSNMQVYKSLANLAMEFVVKWDENDQAD